MAHNLPTQETADVQSTDNTSPGDRSAASTCRRGMMGCGMGKKGLKGMLLMAACCGAPLLLLLALPLMGSALGGLGASAVSTLALLACPVGMALMMWMMMRGQRVESPQPAQAQPASLAQVPSTAPAELQKVAGLPDTLVTATAMPSPPAQEMVIIPSPAVNGHRTEESAAPVNGHPASRLAAADSVPEVAAPTQE